MIPLIIHLWQEIIGNLVDITQCDEYIKIIIENKRLVELNIPIDSITYKINS